MRIDTKHPLSPVVLVTLNGEVVKNVIWADEEKGELECYGDSKEASLFLRTHKLFGTVKIYVPIRNAP